jgi:hypothetical protein
VHTCAVHTVGQLQRPSCDSHHMPGLPAAWRNCRSQVFGIASLPSDALHVARAAGGGMQLPPLFAPRHVARAKGELLDGKPPRFPATLKLR